MADLVFQLFRVQVFYSRQKLLFVDEQPRDEVLREVIESGPSAELIKNHTWQIGNVEEIDGGGLYFRLGRTTSTTKEVFDPDARRFLDVADESSPSTHVVVDLRNQVAAIAAKTRLAPRVQGIANQFSRLLNRSRTARARSVTFKVGSINDPTEFLGILESAYAVKQFTAYFGRPNPWDVNEEFQQPMQRLVEASAAERGRTIISGANLDSGTLEDLTRSTAATGNNASARVQLEEGQPPVTRNLKGDPVALKTESVDSALERIEFLEELRQKYSSVRSGDDVEE